MALTIDFYLRGLLKISLVIILLLPNHSLATESEAALKYLNSLRTSAGMTPFKRNHLLEQSSKNHAIYLVKNRVVGHLESEEQPFFSGKKPGDRAVYAGYEVRDVTENFSAGQKNSLQSIDGLMSAIYHRFGFLDFSKDEIGIALTKMRKGYLFVYNMGNQRLNRFCKFAIDLREGAFYREMCRRSRMVSASRYDQLKAETQQMNPAIVVWPSEGETGIPPAFYEEIPDPLPNLSVSGYPVSIQFNPQFFGQVQLLDFSLFEASSEQKVYPTHLMDRRNDPNQKFTHHQFALFPLNRLKWGTTYKVQISYQHKSKRFDKSWFFTTRRPSSPMFKIAARGESLNVVANQPYLIYVPPASRNPIIDQLKWESPTTVQLDVDWEDKNTIRVSLSGEICQKTSFYLSGNRRFDLQLSQRDNINPEHNYPHTSSLNCILGNIKGIQGFQIAGNGEILSLQAKKEYWIEIKADQHVTANIQLEYSPRMQIDIKHLSKNIIKVNLAGDNGQKAYFSLGDNRSFTIQLAN